MASPGNQSPLDYFLECSICLETLDEPKLLNCAHRFCKECISKEIKRMANRSLHVTFYCPQCRKSVSLVRKTQNDAYVELLETDRLLRNIIESLKEDPDVCASHGMRREVVCHSCQETGCLRCAWTKHRGCSVTRDYHQEAERINLLLQEHLKETHTCLESIDMYVKKWSMAVKSYKNQIEYSNAFFEKSLQVKKGRFLLFVKYLKDSWETYLKSQIAHSRETGRLLNDRMQMIFTQLNIDVKYEDARASFDEDLTALRKQEHDASAKLQAAPEKEHLANIANDISEVLRLEKSQMVVQGEKLLKENRDVLSKSMRRQVLKDTNNTPNTYLLHGLTTQEAQVHLRIEEEEERVGKLVEILEAKHDDQEILKRLDKLAGVSSQKERKDCLKSVVTMIPLFLEEVHEKLSTLTANFFDSVTDSFHALPEMIYDNMLFFQQFRRGFGKICSIIRLIFFITFFGIFLSSVVYVVLLLCISGYQDIVVAMISAISILFIPLLKKKEPGAVFIEPFSSTVRPRRRRRNAAITNIPSTEIQGNIFQTPRPVIIQIRTPIK